MNAFDLGVATIKKWRERPDLMVIDLFGIMPDSWQAKVLKNFWKALKICMTAAKGPGKTTVLAWIAWNFLLTRPKCKIAVTSISRDNLMDGFWAEMAKWYAKSPLLQREFEMTKTRIVNRKDPENWFISARTWDKAADKTKQSNTLAGLHADFILFIIDEAGGVPASVMATAEAALSTGIECKIVIAGNPTHLSGPLWDAANDKSGRFPANPRGWDYHEVTGDPDDPDRAPRISIEWALEMIKKYSVMSPWVMVNVFGKFPPSSMDALLGPGQMRDAMARVHHSGLWLHSQSRLGGDIAFGGADRTVIFPRRGIQAFEPKILRVPKDSPTMAFDIAGHFGTMFKLHEAEIAFVDDGGGFGGGVLSALYMANYRAQGVNFQSEAQDPNQFANRRAEMYFRAAEWVKAGGALPYIEELIAEGSETNYFRDKQGRMQMEPKELVTARLGRSPDLWDAFVLTHAIEDAPAAAARNKNRRARSVENTWDPMDILKKT